MRRLLSHLIDWLRGWWGRNVIADFPYNPEDF